jgi:hypothetical protein
MLALEIVAKLGGDLLLAIAVLLATGYCCG